MKTTFRRFFSSLGRTFPAVLTVIATSTASAAPATELAQPKRLVVDANLAKVQAAARILAARRK
ncbi:hypothetical protein [Bradyrhizobium sp. RDM4]|uniref:hypothetical protein n=1 Tax=Bradyrhizobium sp. RDM4 TaxID=3378765 RepID=UPI0038FBE609